LTDSFHSRYLALVAKIERQFPVTRWFVGDVPVWPLARMQLHSDMFWACAGRSPMNTASFPRRALAAIATPLTNIWKSRRDLGHWLAFPSPAEAIFLGDGVSLDRIYGRWQDRYGEPVMAALESRGLRTFLMQSGDLRRLPWRRATYPANLIALRGALRRAIGRISTTTSVALPDHARVIQFLARNDVRASSLNAATLQLLARKVSATAAEFQRVLRVVNPKVAFTVTYYAGLGAAFLLACRRQGILSVDLQHCPQLGAHKAYEWSALPANGYSTLPAVFWNWTAQEAADIAKWTGTLSLPWHRSLHGGHTQIAPFLSNDDPSTRAWNQKFQLIGNGTSFERDILVALQPIPGNTATWDALAAQIESGNPNWRWWIRRHPAADPSQDLEIQRLLSLRRNNVVIDEASPFPLPALLRHMSVLVSLASGAAAEAAVFGVPAIFLSNEADATFSRLIREGMASVADTRSLNSLIERLPRIPVRPPLQPQPHLDDTLRQLETMAQEYAQLCRDQRSQP
jgi:hypothetical protein